MEKTRWYQNIYIKIAGVVAGIGLLGTMFGYIINGVNFWNTLQGMPGKVKSIELKLDSLVKSDKTIHDFIEKKESSYAVGFRVKKIFDSEMGRYRKVKQYRDWKGYFNDIYIDHELSEVYGVNQYYYIDKDSHEKTYCW